MGGNDAKIGDVHAGFRRSAGADLDDLDHGRQRRPARPQAQPRRAQSAQALRALGTLGRSSARGTSRAVIGPIANRSVVPGLRSPRATRVVRAAAPAGRTAGGRSRRRAAAARGRHRRRSEPPAGGDQLRPVPQLPAPALEREAPGREQIQVVSELEAGGSERCVFRDNRHPPERREVLREAENRARRPAVAGGGHDAGITSPRCRRTTTPRDQSRCASACMVALAGRARTKTGRVR